MRGARGVRLVNRVRSLLAWTLDPATVDQAARVLLGGIPPAPADLTTRLRRELQDFRPITDLPSWATFGVHLAGERTLVRPTLDLDAAEAESARQWPPVTVAAYQPGTDPVCVLVEVGAAGPPTRFTPSQARDLSAALHQAAAIAEEAR